MSKITSRSALPSDMPFIYATWLNGQYYGHAYFRAMDKASYYQHYGEYVRRVLASPRTRVHVLTDAGDTDLILGYAISSEDCLYWAFTKKACRRMGLMRSLLLGPLASVKTTTALTVLGEKLLRKRNWTFNPWITT